MNFYVKRLFLNSNYKLNTIYKKNFYINSPNDYLKNKFLNTLCKKLYNLETHHFYFHDNFKTNYINHILMPELNLYISSINNKNKTYTINLGKSTKNYSKKDIQHNIDKISIFKKQFFYNVKQIHTLFKSMCENSINNLDTKIFNEFKDEFLNHIFKNTNKSNNHNVSEYFISSAGINGFKTFSNYIPSDENKVFIINDNFNLFKNTLINEIIKKGIEFNLPYEIFKSSVDKTIIDHIKFPSLNLCIVSNNFLFKEKIPGIQINEELFYKNNFENQELSKQKNNLENLITNLNALCNSLKNEYIILDNFFEDCVIKNEFENLIDYTLKNVIR